MSQTKKRISKKRASKKTSRPTSTLLASFADRMRGLRDEFARLADDVEEAVAVTSSDDPLPQDFLAAFAYLSAAGYSLDRLTDRAKLSVKEWRNAGGFDKTPCAGHPLAVVGFNITKGARRPKWQEIAAREAADLADLQGVPFDGEVYLDKIKQDTTPGRDAEKVSFTFAE